MRTIAIVQQKGGAGKTPTAVHLSFALARAGNKVLFVDADPQASATLHFLGVKYKELPITLFNAITSTREIERVTHIDPLIINPTLHLLPSHDELEQAEILLTSKRTFKYQEQLARLLRLYADYDYVVIDTPGSRISIFTTLALTAAQLVIVPLRTSYDHLDATKDTMNLIENIKEALNPHLSLVAVLPNQFESNVLHHKDILMLLHEAYNDLVSEPSRKTNKYSDAIGARADIREIDSALGEFWDRLVAQIEAREKVRG
jgi:chromosome partitioning protein